MACQPDVHLLPFAPFVPTMKHQLHADLSILGDISADNMRAYFLPPRFYTKHYPYTGVRPKMVSLATLICPGSTRLHCCQYWLLSTLSAVNSFCVLSETACSKLMLLATMTSLFLPQSQYTACHGSHKLCHGSTAVCQGCTGQTCHTPEHLSTCIW